MPIVFACAGSHAPGITAWTEKAPREQVDRFVESFHELQCGFRAFGFDDPITESLQRDFRKRPNAAFVLDEQDRLVADGWSVRHDDGVG